MRFSIVIPTYRRPVRLARCLDAVARQRFPATEVEVVVVDDAGEPAIAEVVRDRAGSRCTYLPTRRRTGPASARNTGAQVATGEYLVFLDDDSLPHEGWLAALEYATARDDPARPVLFGGRIVDAGEGPCAQASQCFLDYLLTHANRDPDAATFFPSNNIALSRAAFLELGGFDTRFPRAAAEDRDLCERWLARGWRMATVPDAIVAHEHRSNVRAFLRQHAGYGRGLAILNERRAERGSTAPRLQSPRFYLGLIGAGLRFGSLRQRLETGGLLALSQAATLVGYLQERQRLGLTATAPDAAERSPER